MDSFCRFCLESDSNNSFSLFTTTVQDEITVGDVYKTISNINFKNSEDLNGSKICESCLVKVHEFKDFRDTIIYNNITVLKLRTQSVLKYEQNDQPISSESFDDPLLNINNVVEIKMEDLDETPDFFPNLENKDENEHVKIEEFEVKFTPSTSEKRVKRNPKKYQKKNFVYSDHGQILKVNGRITSQTKVICNYCQLELSYPSFKNHYVSLHLQSAVFSCEECDKPFNRRSRLNEHKILAHTVLDNSAFPCQLCGESFPIRSALTTHILKMHKKPKKVQKKYACDVPGCPKKFRSSNNLKTHYNVEHLKIKQHPCLFCERGFATKNYVHEHMTKSHPEFLVEEEIILQNSILKKKKETLKQKVLCTLCGKSFRRDVLPKHTKLVHLKKKDYGCDLCGKRYGLKFHMRDHMLRHLGNRSFTCQQCNKGFTNPSDLRSHRNQTHNLTGTFSCTYPDCNRSFNMKQKVTKHVEFFHVRSRPFGCSLCYRKFFTKISLVTHEAEHFDATDFACDVPECGKMFKSVWKLSRHTKYFHTTPKYKCSYCDKTYHHPKKMQEHENVHKNIREYSCTHCDKAYSTSSYLRMHVKDTHFKAKISCELCGSKLARRENYTMHVKAVHKDLDKEAMDALLAKIKTIKADYDRMEYVYV